MRRRFSTLRTSLRACTISGAFHAAMIGFGESYFAAFALFLGASAFQVGLLTTVPILAGAGFQLLAPFGARLAGTRGWVVGSAVLQGMVFLPIAVLAGEEHASFEWLLLWVCAYWMLALGINPVWNAWMARMFPARIRSRYFGRRDVPIQASLLVSAVGAGMILQGATHTRWGAASGFIAIFSLAAVSRAVSSWYVTKQHDPGDGVPSFSLLPGSLPAPSRGRPYVRLFLLIGCMTSSVHISAAYFTPFMLGNLGLSYAQFTLLNGMIVVSRALAAPYWGEIARAYGNRRALQVAVVLLIPLSGLWVVSSSFAYLLVLQLVAGFAWSGFELMTFLNFFDCTEEWNRARVLSLYNLLNGVAIVGGSLLGGVLLHTLGSDGYFVIFLLSSFGRLVAVVSFGRGVGARRAVEHSFSDVFTRVVTFRPGQGPSLRPIIWDEGEARRSSET